jgi:hypothetical protein
MSVGFIIAASADISAALEIADGFGLDAIDAGGVSDHDAVVADLRGAANVGVLLTENSMRDEAFVALLRAAAPHLGRAQIIASSREVRDAFDFLPQEWPLMALADARERALAMKNQRDRGEQEPAQAQPLPPSAEAPEQESAPAPEPEAPPAPAESSPEPIEPGQDALAGDAPSQEEATNEDLLGGADAPGEGAPDQAEESFGAEPDANEEAPVADEDEAPVSAAPPPAASAPEPQPAPAAPPIRERRDAGAAPEREERSRAITEAGSAAPAPKRQAPAPSAPADATAFAPKKLRRGTPELVRIVVHQPKDLNDVIKAAKKIDPRTEPAPSGVSIGDVAIGAKVGVALEVRGATADGAIQRRTWAGEPIDFSFAVEADASVKQVVLLARVFIDDAQIGVLAFTRNVSGPAKQAHSAGDRVRLKRHKRVFLSYSSKDRETVSQIATAYQMAGVEHFWDRASLKSGEEWHPRLRREIDRADLFHLCWSKAAAESEWVQKEAEYALTRRKKQSGKPDITVQMLDGPPWAPHPPELDTINFDDFVRAAIVGYARGDGS